MDEMNEKIKEIFDRSNEESIADWKKGIRYETSYEKFAKLIVQECINYCGENLSKTVSEALKIHFGVKE